MINIVLFEPEKAGNVGNIARTCSVLGANLHLIKPYGFRLHDKEFKRAVMDYMEGVNLFEYVNWTEFQDSLQDNSRIWAFSTIAKQIYTDADFIDNDYLLFGSESKGLPSWLKVLPLLKLPQPAGGRSLNLSVVVGVAAFEMYRQVKI